MSDPEHLFQVEGAVKSADLWGRATAAFIGPLLRINGVTRPMAQAFTEQWLGWQLELCGETSDDTDPD